MKYFTREASVQSHWKAKTRWKSLWARYELELARTRDRLTPGWRELADSDFHDAEILGVERPGPTEVILRVDGFTLRFFGVREARIPDVAVGDLWLYAEVHLTDGCGDLQVLLRDSELQIIAPDVGVFRHDNAASYEGSSGKD